MEKHIPWRQNIPLLLQEPGYAKDIDLVYQSMRVVDEFLIRLTNNLIEE
tara:strand:- start:147 stop:293 length:147 start_codon:yes stop_codon:yes gene_type:complete